ncbi:hypothetical protein STEG23_017632 [Scotinomys teguina]
MAAMLLPGMKGSPLLVPEKNHQDHRVTRKHCSAEIHSDEDSEASSQRKQDQLRNWRGKSKPSLTTIKGFWRFSLENLEDVGQIIAIIEAIFAPSYFTTLSNLVDSFVIKARV